MKSYLEADCATLVFWEPFKSTACHEGLPWHTRRRLHARHGSPPAVAVMPLVPPWLSCRHGCHAVVLRVLWRAWAQQSLGLRARGAERARETLEAGRGELCLKAAPRA